MTKLITENPPSHPLGRKFNLPHKQNVVLYLDKETVEKSRELGFNLSRICENHLKLMISMVSNQSNSSWWAGPDLNQRPLARKANVLPS
jgi:post-segregation antitoxin (ccd killing protein)